MWFKASRCLPQLLMISNKPPTFAVTLLSYNQKRKRKTTTKKKRLLLYAIIFCHLYKDIFHINSVLSYDTKAGESAEVEVLFLACVFLEWPWFSILGETINRPTEGNWDHKPHQAAETLLKQREQARAHASPSHKHRRTLSAAFNDGFHRAVFTRNTIHCAVIQFLVHQYILQ